MNRLLTAALVLALLILISPFDAGAVDGPHTNTCTACHTAAITPDSSGFNSNCLSCHNSTGSASRRSFDVSDQANISHKWSGPDTVPEAGAQAPTSGALTQVRFYTGSQLACVNCHNPHVNAPPLGYPKFQRVAKGMDQLCLDCHRSRNVQTAAAGSHPVLIGYSSAVKAAPAKFTGIVPLNANPANPNSDLGTMLSYDGKILCTTCHGVHSTDSRSSNYVNGFKNISAGDGKLLRTNPRGAVVAAGSTDKLNICTNCHAGKMNHNGAGQDIQCVDCHGTHVEYDSNDPTGSNGVNVSLIRRNVSKSGQPGKIYFRTTQEYVNTDGTGPGVCQGCHDAPTTGPHTGVQPTDCKNCHTHTNAKGSFSASCNSCHGFPPAIVQHNGSAHPDNTNCSLCHNTEPSVHMNGTVDVSSSCNGCHGNPPAYANGAPKANSHGSAGHLAGCGTCHLGTTATGTTITNTALHMNGVYDLQGGSGASFTYSYAETGGTCSNISCHGNTSATWGGRATCLVCHSVAQGNRAAITSQFNANSHHIQGTLTDDKCYQCHWEANSDGSINSAYHHSSTPGAPVELVIYGAGSRPTTYSSGITAVQYTANGDRSEIQKISSHCLGCHSDQNNAVQPFGDGKTPIQYSWDGTSVGARYSQSGVTAWGKYSSVARAAKKKTSKAYSAHGNAAANKRGWDTANGVDGPIANTSGTVNVQCYDCHNSHGSSVSGTTTRYASATANGGILKDTVAGQGGYNVAYRPYTGGSAANKDKRNPGASLCLDCHMNPNAVQTPWGYSSTYGATQPVLGYWDSPFMSYSTCGPEQRYPYKKKSDVKGGHLGASMGMTSTPTGTIGGLCTPCHDPHGVSPTLGPNQQYAVPLLKGTWVTSPYKEDVAPANNVMQTNYTGEGVQYHIDQNTFGSSILGSVTGMTQSVDQSAGLCLGCHPKNSLTASASPASPNPWKSKNRIHESVKGWKTSTGTVEHNYSCSKCHSAHTSSVLPRLMVTNCLDSRHKGRTGFNPAPVASGWSSGDSGSGSGHIPGSFSGSGYDGGPGDYSITCHDSPAANGFGSDGTNQSWNSVTNWIDATPAITSGPFAVSGGQRLFMHMDETSWNGTPNQVQDSSGGNNNGTSYNGANTVAGGKSGRAGSFGNNSNVTINYASGIPPVDNFTMEAWIKPTVTHQIDIEASNGTSGTYGQKYLFKADQKGSMDSGAGISAGTNGISVYEHGDSYMPALAVYSGAISSSQWNHIAVVYTNKRPSIYVNGTLVRTGMQSLRQHVYAPQVIGAGDYGYFTGLADEVVIYDRPLSPSEVMLHSQQIYKESCSNVQATINWTTDISSTSYIDYGLTSDYGTTAGSDLLDKNHTLTLTNLASQTTYHYRVRSRYESVAGKEATSGDNTFQMGSCTPAVLPEAPTGISATAGNAQATITWTAGTGATSSLIKYGTVSGTYPTTIAPAVSPRLITGLTNGTPVYYRVGAMNADGITWSNLEYSVTPVAPLSPPALISPTATAIDSTTAILGANITSNGGAVITANGTCWGLIASPTTNCVDQGSHATGAFTQSRTGLNEGSRIYYRGYATNSTGTGYSPGGIIYTEPSQPASLSFTGVGPSGITLNWATGSSGNAKNVLVVLRSGSAVNANPVDGVNYMANVAFGSGSQIGSGNYVVYKGTGTSVSVTGLSSGITYHVKVYAFAAGAGGTENYNVISPLTGSQATSIVSGGTTRTFAITHHTGITQSGGVYPDAGDIIWAGPYDGWDVDRSFVMFDTSLLGAGATIISAKLYLNYQNSDYMESDTVTSIHESTWLFPGDGNTYNNVGNILASDPVWVGRGFGLTTFVIRPDYINKVGDTKFAIKAENEDYDYQYNADPGYSRATSYLEITYTN